MGLNIGLYLRRSERTDTEVRSIGTEVRRIGTDFRPRRNKGGGLSHSPRHLPLEGLLPACMSLQLVLYFFKQRITLIN
jgi:hypothetical protein